MSEDKLTKSSATADQQQVTDLFLAAKKGEVEKVAKLLEKKIDVNARGKSNATALHWAAYHSQPEVVSLLLYRRADPSLQDESGYTPLHIAARHPGLPSVTEGFQSIEHLLADSRTDINLKSKKEQKTAAEYAANEEIRQKIANVQQQQFFVQQVPGGPVAENPSFSENAMFGNLLLEKILAFKEPYVPSLRDYKLLDREVITFVYTRINILTEQLKDPSEHLRQAALARLEFWKMELGFRCPRHGPSGLFFRCFLEDIEKTLKAHNQSNPDKFEAKSGVPSSDSSEALEEKNTGPFLAAFKTALDEAILFTPYIPKSLIGTLTVISRKINDLDKQLKKSLNAEELAEVINSLKFWKKYLSESSTNLVGGFAVVMPKNFNPAWFLAEHVSKLLGLASEEDIFKAKQKQEPSLAMLAGASISSGVLAVSMSSSSMGSSASVASGSSMSNQPSAHAVASSSAEDSQPKKSEDKASGAKEERAPAPDSNLDDGGDEENGIEKAGPSGAQPS